MEDATSLQLVKFKLLSWDRRDHRVFLCVQLDGATSTKQGQERLLYLIPSAQRRIPVTPSTTIFPKTFSYNWVVCCDAYGRCTGTQKAGVLKVYLFLQGSDSEAKAMRYKLECIAILLRQVVMFGCLTFF